MTAPTAPATFRYERTLAASPEAVFRAWTDPEELKEWFGPDGFTTVEAEVDLRVGGRYRLAMRTPEGSLLHISGTYRKVRLDERLVYTWTWEHAPDEEMVVTVEFQAVEPDATRVVLTHERIVDGEARRYEAGWTEGVTRLAAFIGKQRRGWR